MRRAVLFSVLCVGGIGFSAGLFGPGTISKAWRGGNDFPAFYTGGALAFSPDLYRADAFAVAQKALTGWSSDQLLFVRMPWQALLLSPLSLLSFHAAHALWTIVCILGVVFFVSCWPGVPLYCRVAAVCWSIPLAMAFLGAQDVPLLLAASGGGFLLLDRGRGFAAGLCISLCLAAKPHIFWPLGMMFASHRMWRCIVGIAVGGGMLAGVSFAVAGRGWVASLAGVLGFIDSKARGELMPTLHGAISSAGTTTWFEAGLIVILAAMVCVIPDWKSAGSAALMIGIIAARHAFLSDCALTLPALFLVWNEPGQRQVLLAACSPLAFIPCALGHPAATVVTLGIGALAVAAFGKTRGSSTSIMSWEIEMSGADN